jgi:hypothetical protein
MTVINTVFLRSVLKSMWQRFARQNTQRTLVHLSNVINGGKNIRSRIQNIELKNLEYILASFRLCVKSIHFLFPSPNTISAFVIQEKPNEKSARDSIQKTRCNLFLTSLLKKISEAAMAAIHTIITIPQIR